MNGILQHLPDVVFLGQTVGDDVVASNAIIKKKTNECSFYNGITLNSTWDGIATL